MPDLPPLPERFSDLPWAQSSLISVVGEDAEAFLNAQVTRNVLNMSSGEKRRGAWCNAQGRVLTTLEIARFDEGFWLRLPRALCPSISKRLKMFVLRSKVELRDYSDELIGEIRGDPQPPNELAEKLTESEPTSIQWEVSTHCGVSLVEYYSTANNAEESTKTNTILAHQRFVQNNPQVFATTSGEFVPHMLGLPDQGFVDFDKGCYPGQEVVAKSQHRGRVKRSIVQLQIEDRMNLEPGVLVECGSGPNGVVVEAHEWQGRTLIQAVLHEESDQSSLRIGDQPCRPYCAS